MIEVLEGLREKVKEVETKQMALLLEIIDPVFAKFGYVLNHKENEPPRFQVGYEGQYEATIKYKSRSDGTLIEFFYQEGRVAPISVSIKARGTMSRKYEKPRTLAELDLAIREALLR